MLQADIEFEFVESFPNNKDFSRSNVTGEGIRDIFINEHYYWTVDTWDGNFV